MGNQQNKLVLPSINQNPISYLHPYPDIIPKPKEAKHKIWRKTPIGDDGSCYLYPVNVENPADYVHYYSKVEDEKDLASYLRGYGGSTLSFELENGKVLNLRGPWHSNPKALFETTGIDITNTHFTYGWVCLKINHQNQTYFQYEDFVYRDTEWVLGGYERIEEIAIGLAQKYKTTVHYYCYTMAGGYGGQKQYESNS